jgi:hypothetical protein
MRILSIAFAALTLCATASASQAAGVDIAGMTMGYTYFNRPGADRATHNADVRACVEIAKHIVSMDDVYTPLDGSGPYGYIGAAIAEASVADAHHSVAGAAFENCMVVRGWRVVMLPNPEWDDVMMLSNAAVAAKIGPWIGSDNPHGRIVRWWGNDANGRTHRFSMRPRFLNYGQLSLRIATDEGLKQFQPVPPEPALPSGPILNSLFAVKVRAPSDTTALPPGAAVVVLSVKSGGGASTLGFGRIPGEGDGLVAFSAGPVKGEVNMLELVVPAGRWRLASMSGLMGGVNFCLGAPTVEVKAGETVYLGTFDLKADQMGPDLSLEAPRAWLGASPLAANLRAASYVNGSTSACVGSSFYALEIKGAPFEPGYRWGGVATPLP